MRIYIGYDSREQRAYDVARKSAENYDHEVIPLYASRLRSAGILTRPVDSRGELWDLNSSAPQSTEFALTRFFVPILAHSGICLFADCDVVFMRDPAYLLVGLDLRYAVSVVKHARHDFDFKAKKMDGQVQKDYPRKLWSSVMLFNCDHPANQRLNLAAVNSWHRNQLHSFSWLADEEIGSLPPEANWLVGVDPKPESPIIAHYTLGTPDMPGYENCNYADIWLQRVSQ